MLSLNSYDVWPQLLEDWEHSPRAIAVAYYSNDDGMSFCEGDILVVDASEKAVSCGQTNPTALLRALEAGAKVYSVPSLHAKVYVLGNRMYIGSANASTSSRENLVECMVFSDEPHLVGDAISFIEGLSSSENLMDKARLKALEDLYVPPQIPKGRRPEPAASHENHFWIVGIVDAAYPGDEEELDRSMKRMKRNDDIDGQHLDHFWWDKRINKKFSREAKKGDQIIQIYKRDDRTISVYRHCRIHKIEDHPKDNTRVYFCVSSKDYEETRITLADFKKLAKKAGINKKLLSYSCCSISRPKSEFISAHWPTPKKRKKVG